MNYDNSLYEVEDLLNDLKVDILEYQMISDGDIDYFIFTSSNLEEEQRNMLNDLGFDELRDNLFISEDIVFNKNKIWQILSPFYCKTEKRLWNDILSKIHKLNEQYLLNKKHFLFNFSNDHIILPLKWDGILTTNKNELNEFVTDLNKLVRLSCRVNRRYIIEDKYKKHIFWNLLSSIRNRGAHLSTEEGINGALRLVMRETESYKLLINKESPSADAPFDFIAVQIRLLEFCDAFLEDILNDLRGQ